MHSALSRRLSFSLGLAAVVSPTLAWAHPGHGQTNPESVAHFALEPIHSVPVVALLLAVAAARLLLARSRRQLTRLKAPK